MLWCGVGGGLPVDLHLLLLLLFSWLLVLVRGLGGVRRDGGRIDGIKLGVHVRLGLVLGVLVVVAVVATFVRLDRRRDWVLGVGKRGIELVVGMEIG